MAGVRLAGFSARAKNQVDLPVVPYPAVTLVIDLGHGPLLVEHASGQPQRGSLAAGLAPGAVRARGRDIECLQVRLSPVVAHAVLGACSELGGTVAALDDLWGRDAARIEEQLRAAGTTGSPSPRPRSPGDTRRAGRPTRKSPSPGVRW
jgi:hypothetical protein